jgi:hypothetical protein
LEEQAEGFVTDPILGIIQEKLQGFGCQPLAALRVLRKELTQM